MTRPGLWSQYFIAPGLSFWKLEANDTTQAGHVVFELPPGLQDFSVDWDNGLTLYGASGPIPNATWTIRRIVALIYIISMGGKIPILWVGNARRTIITHTVDDNGVVGPRVAPFPLIAPLPVDFEFVKNNLRGGTSKNIPSDLVSSGAAEKHVGYVRGICWDTLAHISLVA